jgi:hypothetical protein
MNHIATLMMALDLLHVPSRVRLIRSAPLPDGIETLLHIAAGDHETIRQASAAIGIFPERIREAAGFFIEQALLHPEADSYRVLGARPGAGTAELRRNMALLIRWLHPDHGQGERSVFTHRVTRAWNDLKTKERRASYDRQRRIALTEKSLTRKKAHTSLESQAAIPRPRSIPPHAIHSRRPFKSPPPPGLLRRMLLLLLGRVVY